MNVHLYIFLYGFYFKKTRYKHSEHHKHKFLNAMFESIVNEELCVSCGTCVDRCPVGAIEIDDFAVVSREKCLGCGLCATACPEEAITMRLRKDGEEPFNRVMEMGFAVLEGKRKNLK